MTNTHAHENPWSFYLGLAAILALVLGGILYLTGYLQYDRSDPTLDSLAILGWADKVMFSVAVPATLLWAVINAFGWKAGPRIAAKTYPPLPKPED